MDWEKTGRYIVFYGFFLFLLILPQVLIYLINVSINIKSELFLLIPLSIFLISAYCLNKILSNKYILVKIIFINYIILVPTLIKKDCLFSPIPIEMILQIMSSLIFIVSIFLLIYFSIKQGKNLRDKIFYLIEKIIIFIVVIFLTCVPFVWEFGSKSCSYVDIDGFYQDGLYQEGFSDIGFFQDGSMYANSNKYHENPNIISFQMTSNNLRKIIKNETYIIEDISKDKCDLETVFQLKTRKEINDEFKKIDENYCEKECVESPEIVKVNNVNYRCFNECKDRETKKYKYQEELSLEKELVFNCSNINNGKGIEKGYSFGGKIQIASIGENSNETKIIEEGTIIAITR